MDAAQSATAKAETTKYTAQLSRNQRNLTAKTRRREDANHEAIRLVAFGSWRLHVLMVISLGQAAKELRGNRTKNTNCLNRRIRWRWYVFVYFVV
jgi:hypothetical protein